MAFCNKYFVFQIFKCLYSSIEWCKQQNTFLKVFVYSNMRFCFIAAIEANITAVKQNLKLYQYKHLHMLPHLNEIQNMQLEERTNKTKTNVNYFYKLQPQNSLSLADMWHIVFPPVHQYLIHVVKQHCSSLLQFSFWQWRLIYVQYSVISSLQVPFHFQSDMIFLSQVELCTVHWSNK